MSGDLSDYRKEIDRIDDEILRLLNERSKSVVQIGRLKILKDAGANLHTPAREAAIIERLVAQNTGPFPSDAIRPVYREIMSASLSLEGPQKVAYLGPRATFTHMACTQKFGASAQYVPVNSIKEVFSEVERGRANFGVVPIENTTEGVVNHTLDLWGGSSGSLPSSDVEVRGCRGHKENLLPSPRHRPMPKLARDKYAPRSRFGGREYGPGSRDVPGRFLDRSHCFRVGFAALWIKGHQVPHRRQSQQLYAVPRVVAKTTSTHRQRQDVAHAVH
jgi:chorismate mutase-like protein